jgi:hypothetical protein
MVEISLRLDVLEGSFEEIFLEGSYLDVHFLYLKMKAVGLGYFCVKNCVDVVLTAFQ